ncbi:hypothetical protein M9H77_04912 [Catharanthus roseus]|uniref:Uncharacterized protein n=1 Tax=Catharanthus roseus TaxID=4058 RepID=A0ACC0CFW5_CATRO|nr:hypothetical protein M9H77_04912 [Catharanthus roseus]
MSPGEADSSRPNDVFGQVLGKEKCNFMYKYRFSSNEGMSEGNELPSKRSSSRIMDEQRKELEKMNEKSEKQKHINEDQENCVKELNTIVTQLTIYPFFMVFMLVGSHISLKNFEDLTKIVTTRYLVSSNPTKLVGSHELGPNFVEVVTFIYHCC